MLGKRQERERSYQNNSHNRPIGLYVRGKHIEQITTQLEYYWSDANIKRDIFFADRLAQDAECWVTVGELLTFPIIKSMKATAEDVILAARRSEFFVVNEDNSPPVIDRDWRKFPPRESIDIFANQLQDSDRTVYIEPLPLTVNRDQLATLLDRVGTVQHISIPRHNVSGERLGHAFVEFLTATEARECIKKLQGTWPDEWRRRRDGKRLTVLSYKRWLALKDEIKMLSKQSSLPKYCQEIQKLISDHPTELVSDTFIVPDSDDDQDGATSAIESTSEISGRSKIRPNSLLKISDLPLNCGQLDLKIWLAHFASPVQHVDFRPSAREAYVRLANRPARDFFMVDFVNHKLSFKGVFPKAEILSEEEFQEYFENFQRERLRMLRTLGPVALAGKRSPRIFPTGKQTMLQIKRGWTTNRRPSSSGANPLAWTDTVAGNEKWAASGTSDSFRRPFERMSRNQRHRSPAGNSPRKRPRLSQDI